MAGTSYTRQSTIADGNLISASLFNNEYNQIVNAFAYASSGTTGHTHDGSAGQGGNISKMGDQDFLNKIEVDSTNNRIGVYVEVSSAAVEQIRVQDGAIVPVTDNDIDLGTSSLEFKDLYIDGTANIDSLVLASGSTVTAVLDEDDMSSDSATALATQQSIKAYIATQVGTVDTLAEILANGNTAGTDINFADNDKVIFGAGTDLQIYHSGSNSIIKENGTGDLRIQGDEVSILNSTGTENKARFTSDAAVKLYYDNAEKIKTTTGGVEVTGNIVVSGTVDGRDLQTDGTKLDAITASSTELAILDGATVTTSELNILDGVTSTTAELNILDGVTATTTELNILDGVTATTAELNIIDGDTSATSTTLADADRVIVNDAGTMKQVALTDFETYFEGAIDTINGDLTITGDLTISGDDLTMATNSAGHLLIADGTNFNPTAVGDLIEISTVADNDVLLAFDTSANVLKKITRSTLVAGLATSTGISNVVEDTTPQLGGDLDVNGNAIVSASNGNIAITPNGTGVVRLDGNVDIESGSIDLKNSGSVSNIKFYCESSNAHYAQLQSAPHSAYSGNITLTLPASTDTLVGRATTDTLTNKTLTSPDINGGTVDNAVIGGSTAAAGSFTTLSASSTFTLGGTAVTSTAAELNILDGVTATATELNYVDGVTSAIQTQLDAKLPLAGGTLTGDLILGDNIKIEVGSASGGDLQIYHDGSNSYIDDAGAGNLYIRGSDMVRLQSITGERYMQGTADGVVSLYFNNSEKLVTSSSGVTISGELATDTLSVGGTAVTSTAAELNILDGVTATATELNLMDGVTATTTELNYVDGVTSAIQTQIDGKLSTSGGTISGDLTIDDGTNTTLDIISDDTGMSQIRLYGSSQGTGRCYVGQTTAYGGGIEYNGDNSPTTTGSGSDYVTLFRNNNNTFEWTARNYVSNNDWDFRGNITAYASDERLKENVETIPDALDKVTQLRGVTFDWKDDCEEKGFLPAMKHETGVIAQEVQAVIPDAAVPAPFDNDYLTVKHDKIIPVLIEAIKELKAEVDKLKGSK